MYQSRNSAGLPPLGFVRWVAMRNLLHVGVDALIACLLLAGCEIANGQAGASSPQAEIASSPATARSPSRSDDVLLQFESILQSEAKAHGEYLRDTLDHLQWIVGIFGGIALGIFTWLNFKSGKD